MRSIFLTTIIIIIFSVASCAQKPQPDRDYEPKIEKPLFKKSTGPIIAIDNGHNNFHTLESGYAPFGKVAELDGFKVKSIKKFDKNSFNSIQILVIVNALHEKNINKWERPVYSAFNKEEIENIKEWVLNGGKLFLIADHMPFAGAASELAQAFGYIMHDGFAYNSPQSKYDLFCIKNMMLNIASPFQSIDSIYTYTGQGFNIPDEAVSIITFDSSYKILMPQIAWKFSRDMDIIDAGGMSQLAYSTYGKGKIIICGEASMFTAQKVEDFKFGMNSDLAKYNIVLLRQLLAWLS